MRVESRYLVVGPLIHIGDQPIRNAHLMYPDRDGMTVCGRSPSLSDDLPSDKRWFPLAEAESLNCKLLECPTCQRFAKEFAANEHTD